MVFSFTFSFFPFYISEGLLSIVQEWPEEVYPPYANGPGYIISIDIAKFVISQHGSRSLRVSY